MKMSIYCDGSGNTFDSDGGWGYRILIDEVVVEEGSGYLSRSTNNIAELRAAIEGLKRGKAIIDGYRLHFLDIDDVELVSDSQLVLGYATGKYKCKAMHLALLCIELKKLFAELKVVARWQRGHAGEVNNEACDKLAKAARQGKGA